eukprot:3663842-Rhodomonas_salina.2
MEALPVCIVSLPRGHYTVYPRSAVSTTYSRHERPRRITSRVSKYKGTSHHSRRLSLPRFGHFHRRADLHNCTSLLRIAVGTKLYPVVKLEFQTRAQAGPDFLLPFNELASESA